MKSLSHTSAAMLWGVIAIPAFAQEVIVFDNAGLVVDDPTKTNFLSVDLPTREWVFTEVEVKERSWVFAEAEDPEVEWTLASDPRQVMTEAEELVKVVAEVKTHFREVEASTPRIEVAAKPPPVAKYEKPKVEDLIDQGKVLRFYTIQFDYNQAILRPEAEAAIRQIAEALNRAPTLNIFVEGHTDARGGDAYNLDLSRRRAVAVVDALVSVHGIDQSRLTPLGIGKTRILDPGDTEAAHQRNRRVEIRDRAD